MPPVVAGDAASPSTLAERTEGFVCVTAATLKGVGLGIDDGAYSGYGGYGFFDAANCFRARCRCDTPGRVTVRDSHPPQQPLS
jgi:hypothetical protein